MFKFVVTGGAGFIGSHIVEELVKLGHTVTVIDDLANGKSENIKPFLSQIKFVPGSILDLALLKKEFVNVDYVLHQAAIPSVPRSIKDPLITNQINIEGTLNVFIAARDCQVKRVVYASSSSVYGDSPTLPKVETMGYNPQSFYASHKMLNEIYGKLFFRLFGLETIGLRYFNVFGPRQDPHSEYAAVIPKFIKLISKGESPTIFGDGETTRDFTYVYNVVQANLLACTAPNIGGEIFNIACGERISLNELIQQINLLLNQNIKPQYADFRAGDIKHSLADISKAKLQLGFQPEINFERGLKETILFFTKDVN